MDTIICPVADQKERRDMSKRLNQKFHLILTDKELYYLEDALKCYRNKYPEQEKVADELAQKLYSEAWEAEVYDKNGLPSKGDPIR